MKRFITIILLTALLTGTQIVVAQVFNPIPVSGFNIDAVADWGNSSLAATSTAIDASNHVMYTQAFAAANNLFGGILNSGTFVNGNYTYQMAPYSDSNALYLSADPTTNVNSVVTGTLTLNTPGSYTRLSLLAFGTEKNTSIVNVTFNFTDGTTASGGTLNILDWFDSTPFVFSNLGRITRDNGSAMVVDGLSMNDPRLYSFDFTVPCANQSKLLQSITFTYVQNANIAARAVILALSGVTNIPATHAHTVTDDPCGNGAGSVAETITGGNAPFTYLWNTSPAQTAATAANLRPGQYIVTMKDANGCTTNDTATVAKLSTAQLNVSASPAQVCRGEQTNLSATGTGGTLSNYLWAFNQSAQPNTSDNPDTTTHYIVTAKDNFGCVLKDSVIVNVKPTPASGFTIAKNPVCLGDTDLLQLDTLPAAGSTYTWTGANVTSAFTTVFNSPGNYQISLQVTQDGCTSLVSTRSVSVSAPPTVSFSVGKSPICAGDATTITFTGNASATAVASWNWDGGVVQNNGNPNGSNLGPYTVRYNQNGTINLTVTDGACTVNATPQTVNVISIPTAAFTPDILAACTPADINFTNESQNADSYQWSFGDGGKSTDVSLTHTYTGIGVYTVSLIATAQGMCSDTLTKTNLISIQAPPVAAFSAQPGENQPIEFKLATFSFTNSSEGAVSYAWDFGDGGTSTMEDPQHKYESTGDFVVTLFVTNSIGCVDSVSHSYYKVIPDLVLDIPNAFSPNGDGTNDRWVIDGLKARPNAVTEIYNRYGEIVYKEIGFAGGWDGNRNGKEMPQGTYYYVIKTAPDEKPYAGWVVLLR
jgi:gliding motility-associated-like protein